jgi:hypothetical protein
LVVPNEAADAVGAVVDPIPPEAVLYQSRFVPVAVSCTDGEPWHKTNGLVTLGATGTAVTFTVITALVGLSQLFIVCVA